MTNLNRAKNILQNDITATCVLTFGETVYISKKTGIAPMIDFIEAGYDLNGFSAADKIVGKAAALLFAFAGVKAVFAEVLSEKAIEVFEKHNMRFSYTSKTEQIQNRQGNGICPMEKAVKEVDSPKQALLAIQKKLQELRVL